MLADVECGGAVVRLFADSPDLAEAGLDWEEYYAKIEEDLEASRYSQYAAAFLLTLLPNVETLTLPKCWKPLEATDKLIDVVIRKVRLFFLSKKLESVRNPFQPICLPCICFSDVRKHHVTPILMLYPPINSSTNALN